MKAPKAPAAPDPVVTAGAQTGSNIGTAVAQGALNNVNQVTPYGNLTYNQTGMKNWTDPLSGKTYELPQYTATQTLSPQQQKLLNGQTQGAIASTAIANKSLGKLGSILGTRVDTSGAQKVGLPTFQTMGGTPQIATTYGDPGGYGAQTRQVQDAIMAKAQPGLNQSRQAMTAQLANQGIKQGTEAYDRAMANLGMNENDMRLNAILAGGQEQSRLAGLDQSRAQFGNDARQQTFDNQLAARTFNNAGKQQTFGNQQGLRSSQMQEAYAARSQPLNEILTLLGLGQVQNPNFVNTPGSSVANTDYAGLVQNNYQNKLAAWQQQQQQSQSLMGGLFGLGASGIMAMSDRRLKTDVSFLGMLRDLPIYAYRYIWGGPMQVGVMAQEMLALRPSAVVVTPSGYLAVDYGAL